MITFRKKSMPPAMHPSAGLVSYVGPKEKQKAITAAWYAMGGQENYNAWAKENPTEYYNKHWLRDVPRPSTVEHTSDGNIEALLKKARGDDAKVINGEFTEVEDAVEE